MIMHITDASTVKLQKLDGTYVTGMVNESLLKPYYDGHDMSRSDCIVHKKKMQRTREGNCYVAHLQQNQEKLGMTDFPALTCKYLVNIETVMTSKYH